MIVLYHSSKYKGCVGNLNIDFVQIYYDNYWIKLAGHQINDIVVLLCQDDNSIKQSSHVSGGWYPEVCFAVKQISLYLFYFLSNPTRLRTIKWNVSLRINDVIISSRFIKLSILLQIDATSSTLTFIKVRKSKVSYSAANVPQFTTIEPIKLHCYFKTAAYALNGTVARSR